MRDRGRPRGGAPARPDAPSARTESGRTPSARTPGARTESARTPRAGTPWARTRERGSVTAELAVALPAVVLVLVVVLTVGAASTAHLRALDAARSGARAAALGADDPAVADAVRRVGGGNASASTRRDGTWVTVRVDVPVAGGWLAAGPLHASADATAWVEP